MRSDAFEEAELMAALGTLLEQAPHVRLLLSEVVLAYYPSPRARAEKDSVARATVRKELEAHVRTALACAAALANEAWLGGQEPAVPTPTPPDASDQTMSETPRRRRPPPDSTTPAPATSPAPTTAAAPHAPASSTAPASSPAQTASSAGVPELDRCRSEMLEVAQEARRLLEVTIDGLNAVSIDLSKVIDKLVALASRAR